MDNSIPLNIPCWLSRDDKEVVQTLINLGWYYLDEDPRDWKDWEYKLCSYQGWTFWATPGECCLLVVRCGAAFCLSLEGTDLDFEGELKKGEFAISQVLKQQKLRGPQQLTLF